MSEWISSDLVLINEEKKYFKPNHWSFDRMMLKCYEKYPNGELAFYYVGDNTEKDFLAGNELGWMTVCLLDDGRNIHKQEVMSLDFHPQATISEMAELLNVL